MAPLTILVVALVIGVITVSVVTMVYTTRTIENKFESIPIDSSRRTYILESEKPLNASFELSPDRILYYNVHTDLAGIFVAGEVPNRDVKVYLSAAHSKYTLALDSERRSDGEIRLASRAVYNAFKKGKATITVEARDSLDNLYQETFKLLITEII